MKHVYPLKITFKIIRNNIGLKKNLLSALKYYVLSKSTIGFSLFLMIFSQSHNTLFSFLKDIFRYSLSGLYKGIFRYLSCIFGFLERHLSLFACIFGFLKRHLSLFKISALAWLTTFCKITHSLKKYAKVINDQTELFCLLMSL